MRIKRLRRIRRSRLRVRGLIRGGAFDIAKILKKIGRFFRDTGNELIPIATQFINSLAGTQIPVVRQVKLESPERGWLKAGEDLSRVPPGVMTRAAGRGLSLYGVKK